MKNKPVAFLLLFLCFALGASAQPSMSVTPASLNATINSCNDSTTLTFTINNGGPGVLNYSILDGQFYPVPDFDTMYIANGNDNNISIFNLATNTTVGTVPVGFFPWRCSIKNDASEVWVSNRDGNSVTVINTTTNATVATIAVGQRPTGIAFTPDGNFAYVGNRWDGTVSKIDCSTYAVVATLSGPFGEPQDIVISPDGTTAYVADATAGIVIWDVTTDIWINTVGNTFAGAHSICITPDGQYVYITESWDNFVQCVSTATNTIIASVGGSFAIMDTPHGIDVSPDGNYIYVLDKWNGQVDRIDVATNTLTASTPYDARLDNAWDVRVSRDGNTVYATYPWWNVEAIVNVDATTMNTVTAHAGGSGARGSDLLKGDLQWAAQNPSSGTIGSGGNTIVTVTFYSAGLNSGVYNGNIFVMGNDPTNLVDTIPITLTVNGSPQIALGATCLDMDTAMVAATNNASVYVYNTGCDTLFGTSITTGTTDFSVTPASGFVLPGDSSLLDVSFTPTAPGNFTDTVYMVNNDVDTFVCLVGVGIPAPAMSVSPPSLSTVINSCNDSVTVQFTVTNSGGSNLDYCIGEGAPVIPFDSVYVACQNDDAVRVLDKNTGLPVGALIPAGNGPWRIQIKPDASEVWVSNRFSDDVMAINTTTRAIVATMPTIDEPTGIAFSADGSTAYVCARNGGTFYEIDATTYTVTNTITGLGELQDVVLHPNGTTAYVGDRFNGIHVVNLSTFTITTTVGGGNGAHSMVIRPDGQYVYVTERFSNNVVVLNTTTNTIDFTLTGMPGPHGIDISADGTEVFVSTVNPPYSLMRIDATTNTIVGPFNDPGTLLNSDGWATMWVADDVVWVTEEGQDNLIDADPQTNQILSQSIIGNRPNGITGLASGIPWLNTDIICSTVAAGGFEIVNVTLYSAGLTTGTHNANIFVMGNDPTNPVDTIPVTLIVNGAPSIALSNTCLDLDTAMVGATNQDSAWIYNTGCDTLFISNATGTIDFGVTPATDTVLPFDSTQVYVTFSPSSPANFVDTVYITNNDVDTFICLIGVGIPAPTISYSPTTFNLALNSCCDSLADTLTVYNTGGAPLTWSITTPGAGAGGCNVFFDGFESGSHLPIWTAGTSPTTYTTITTNPAEGIYNQQLAGGNNSHYQGLEHNFGPSNPTYVGFWGKSNSATLADGYFVIGNFPSASTNQQMAFCYFNSNGLLTLAGPNVTTPYVAGMWYHIEFTNINYVTRTFDWYVNGALIQAGVSFRGNNVPTMNIIELYNFNNSTSWFDAICVGDGPPSSGWLTLSSYADTTAVGDSTKIGVMVNSCGLPAGVHNANIIIASNDPTSPIDSIPVTFTVTGQPDIALSDTCLYLDSIMVFTTSLDSFVIYNNGCDSLVITDANNNLVEFSLSDTSGTIAPFDSTTVYVTFSPTVPGFYQDTITILNNDSTVTLCLTGWGFPQPVISVNPDSFNVTINSCCDSIIDSLKIHNTGLTPLVWSLCPDPGFFDDFDPGIDASMWANMTGTPTTLCGAVSGNNVRFSNAGLREAQTVDMDFSCAATVDFWFLIGPGGSCDQAEFGEDVVLEYSLNGGGTWTQFGFYNENAYPTLTFISEAIPAAAQTPSTRIRWRQLSHSGACCDHWVLDDVAVTTSTSGGGGGGSNYITYTPDTGTVAPGDSMNVLLQWNSCGLLAGTYVDTLIVQSNDPLTPNYPIVSYFTVNATEEITLSDTCLYLDSIMEFTTSIDSFYIFNTGCDTLTITDGNLQTTFFTLSDTSGVLPPGDSGVVFVTFAPTAPGFYQDTVTILNSDSTVTLCLSGWAFQRPVISFDPDSFNITLNTCCDSIRDSLTIYNTGGSDLIFNANACGGVPVLDSILSKFNLNHATITALVPAMYSFTDGIVGTNIPDGGGDMYDGGNFLNTNYMFSIPYSDNVIQNNGAFGPTGKYFTRKQNGIFMMAADLDATQYFELTGNLGADGSGTADDAILSSAVCGRNYTGFVKRVYNAFDPSINHLIIVESDPALNHTWSTNTNDDQHRVNNLNIPPSTRLYYLLYASAGGGYINNTQTQAIMDQFLASCVQSTPPWINISPTNDTIVPGDSSVVYVDLNACNTPAGTHTTEILIQSNDPLNSPDTIPVTFTINGVPDISLSDSCLYLDSIMEFTTSIDSFYVHNTGCDTLDVTDANNNLIEYTLSDTSGTIPPFDSALVYVTFAPTAPGQYQDTITILNNDSTVTVCLNGYAYPRPIASYSTDTVMAYLGGCCDSIVDSLWIYNDPSTTTDLIVNLGGAGFFDSTSFQNWVGSGTTTFHTFNGVPVTSDSLYLTVTINGDYDGATESADLWIEGNFMQTIIDGNPPNGTNIVTNYTYGGPMVSGWFADGILSVDIANSPQVDDFVGTNVHEVRALIPGIGWLDLTPVTDTIMPGDSALILVEFNNCLLDSGIYYGDILVNTNDPLDSPDTVVAMFIVDTLPAVPTFVTDTAICFGDPMLPLIAAGTGDSLMWYSDPGLTTLVHVGDTFYSTETLVGQYTYYVVNILDSCQSPADSGVLTINGPPGSLIVADTAVCEGQTIPDLIAVGGTFVIWSDTLGNQLFIGDTFATGETTAGVYWYYVQDSVGGCNAGPIDTVILTIDAVPLAPIPATDTLVCDGDPMPALSANGTNLTWYSDPGLTTVVGTGNPYTPPLLGPGVYGFYVTDSVAGCQGPADTATLTIQLTPPPTSISNDTNICAGDPMPTFTATGVDIKWYDNPALITVVAIGPNYTPPPLGAGVYTFYATDSVAPCESTPLTVQLTVTTTPGAPTAPNVTSCFGQPTPDLTATGVGTFQWYDDAGLTNLVFTGSPFPTGETAVGNYTYYVVDSLLGCVGPATTVTLDIVTSPAPPVSADITVCEGGPVPDLTATGSGLIKWYDDAPLTNLVGTGNPFAHGQTLPGVYPYYVTDSIAGCEGPSDTVYVTINANPAVPAVSDTAVCQYQTIPDFIYNGTFTNWYDTLGNNLFAGDTFATGQILPGVYYYVVTDSVDQCPETAGDTAVLTIYQRPDTLVGMDAGACFGDPVPDLYVMASAGDSITWFDTTWTQVAFGDTFPTGETAIGTYIYYVIETDTVTGCVSVEDTVTLDISVPLSAAANDTLVCEGFPTPPLIVTFGTNITWYDTALAVVGTGDTLWTNDTLPGVYTYYVTQNPTGCESLSDTVTLTIFATPPTPNVNDTNICVGDSIAPFIYNGGTVEWYSDPGLTTLVFTGDTFNTGQTVVGAYTYWLIDIQLGCVSAVDSATLFINPIPPTPVANDITLCEGDSVPPLIATGGTNYHWYSDPALTIEVFPGDTFFTGDSIAATYTYYVTDSAGGCHGSSDTVVLQINPIPGAPTTSDTLVCIGDPVPDLIATSPSDSTLWYTDPALTTLVHTGDTFPTGQTAGGTYTYYTVQWSLGCIGPSDTVTLTIDTVPQLALSAICFDFDTVIEGTTAYDTLWIMNTRCDTIYVDSITNLLAVYGVDTTNFAIGGGDSVGVVISFAPVGSNQFLDTLQVYFGNLPDTTICLAGVGIGAPDLTMVADTFNFQFGGCCDSTTASFWVWNTGDPGAADLDIVITADSSSWFSFNPDSASIQQSDSVLIDVTVLGCMPPGTYQAHIIVTSNDPTNGTDSIVVNIIKDSLPPTPIANDTVLCVGDSVPPFIAIFGDTITWYDTSWTVVGSGDTLYTNDSLPGVYTYYLTNMIDSCESLADTVTLTINAPPTTPVVSDTTLCEYDSIPPFIYNGNQPTWWDTLGNQLYVGDTFNTMQTLPGVYTYLVTDSTGGCSISMADTAILTINVQPAPPMGMDTAACFGSGAPSLVATGTNVIWYDTSMAQVFVGDTFPTTDTTVGIHTYYVTQTVNGCVSEFDTVILTISVNTPPTVSDTAICFGDPTPLLVATGGSDVHWYKDPTLTVLLHVGDTLNTNQIQVGYYPYYVTSFPPGCPESVSDTAALTIHPNPLVTANTYSAGINPGDSVMLQAYNGVTFAWSPAAGLNTTTGSTVWASPAVSTMYTVTGTNDVGCSGDTAIWVWVKGTGIEDQPLANSGSVFETLNLYPNPTRGIFMVEFYSNTSQRVELSLMTTLGQQVRSRLIQTTQGNNYVQKFDIGSLAPGVYYLRAATEEGVINRRLIIE